MAAVAWLSGVLAGHDRTAGFVRDGHAGCASCASSTTSTRCRTNVYASTSAPPSPPSIQDGGRDHHAVQSRRRASCRPITTSPACRSNGCSPLLPELPIEWDAFEHSPITGIHLWFDRPITDLPHATLLDRTIQWMFNKSEGRYIQLVVSASRSLTEMPRKDVIDLAVRELAEFFPTCAKREARESAGDQRSARHVLREAGAGSAASRQRHAVSQLLPRRRLDPLRLARHHGRRGPQRLSGGRSGHTPRRARRRRFCCRISHNKDQCADVLG